jgi:hypothetical protein
MKVTSKYLRRIIQEELFREQGDTLSNADFTKQLKGGAADIASSVPVKLNNDLAGLIKALVAMAQFDKAKFEKVTGIINTQAATALAKSEKGEKPDETAGDGEQQK